MKKNGINVGDIKPLYNIVGFQVCKSTSENIEDVEWIEVEKQVDAEVLSFIYRRDKPIKKTISKVKEIEEDEKEEDDLDLIEKEL